MKIFAEKYDYPDIGDRTKEYIVNSPEDINLLLHEDGLYVIWDKKPVKKHKPIPVVQIVKNKDQYVYFKGPFKYFNITGEYGVSKHIWAENPKQAIHLYVIVDKDNFHNFYKVVFDDGHCDVYKKSVGETFHKI